MINLSFIRTFVSLAETGGFSASARALGLSQPTVSQHLRKLEEVLGVRLIERRNTSCSLTAQGAALLPHAMTLLRSAERFAQVAEQQQLTIGCSGNIASYFISPELKAFVDQVCPGLSWRIHTDSNPVLLDALRTDAIDVAAMEWPANEDGLQTHFWREEDLVVIAPPGHALVAKDHITFSDLAKLDLIAGESGSGTVSALKRVFGSKAERLQISHQFQSTEAVKSAVKAGLGCSIVLRRAVEDDLVAGKLVQLKFGKRRISKSFHLAASRDLPSSAPALKLISFLKAA